MVNETAWREVHVRGVVQGVGFRPAVWRHAHALNLIGGVRNTLGGVTIVIGGPARDVERFIATLPEALPSVACIENLESHPSEPIDTDQFAIWPSEARLTAQSVIPPDLATCDGCLAEVLSPDNRRCDYAFTACAQCGPRFTMVEALPYDRARTTMRDFPLCDACQDEYDSPAERRYHAESTACPACGPQLRLLQPGVGEMTGDQAFVRAVALLRDGAVGAIKGIGGFHLCCDALNEAPIARLRQRKRRPAKPFAVMAASARVAARFVGMAPPERELLESPARPIVLMNKIAGAAPEILAPDNARLGVMLPCTPLHHLLARRFALLVMTSANESEEPIFCEDDEVAPWLGEMVDFILTHNRRIWNRCDDSVALVHGGSPVLIRRARGYVPRPVRLAKPAEQEILACGGDLKNVFALARGHSVYLSAHMGDLENAAALENYARQIERMQALLGIAPARVAHDMHPGYHSTQFAQALPVEEKLAVQHHHAHLAACLAEHDRDEPAIGLIFDGTGYGVDATVWGGEFLVGDAREYRRMAAFAGVPMPGAGRAIREPWRMALAALVRTVGTSEAVDEVAARMPDRREEVHLLGKAIESGAPFPMTSSAGRLFDVMAFLLGAPGTVSFEAQHAMALEAMARNGAAERAMPGFALQEEEDLVRINPAAFWSEVVRRVRQGERADALAASFHAAFCDAAAAVAIRLRESTGLKLAVCSGGVFANAIIAQGVVRRLRAARFVVLTHRLTPPGDGCVALGQAAVAAAAGK